MSAIIAHWLGLGSKSLLYACMLEEIGEKEEILWSNGNTVELQEDRQRGMGFTDSQLNMVNRVIICPSEARWKIGCW